MNIIYCVLGFSLNIVCGSLKNMEQINFICRKGQRIPVQKKVQFNSGDLQILNLVFGQSLGSAYIDTL